MARLVVALVLATLVWTLLGLFRLPAGFAKRCWGEGGGVSSGWPYGCWSKLTRRG